MVFTHYMMIIILVRKKARVKPAAAGNITLPAEPDS